MILRKTNFSLPMLAFYLINVPFYKLGVSCIKSSYATKTVLWANWWTRMLHDRRLLFWLSRSAASISTVASISSQRNSTNKKKCIQETFWLMER